MKHFNVLYHTLYIHKQKSTKTEALPHHQVDRTGREVYNQQDVLFLNATDCTLGDDLVGLENDLALVEHFPWKRMKEIK